MFSIPFLHSLFGYLNVSAIDDNIDTLSCFITAFMYLFSAILISAKTYVGSPIECWLPQTYSDEWGEFSENYCFLKDTYWYPSDQPMGDIPAYHKENHRLQYYQWSSMYLSLAGLVFMIPKFIWKLSQKATDMPILYFCETTQVISKLTSAQRRAKIAEMAELLEGKVLAYHMPHSMSSIRPYAVYHLVKLLYAIIVLCQFIMLGVFIGQGHDIAWGWHLAVNLFNGVTWEKTGLFPRITFCDFSVRELAGNSREETIQCVMGINEFNEKIFLFFWFWLVFVFVATLIGNTYSYIRNRNNNIVYHLLHMNRKQHPKDLKRRLRVFADNYLNKDGQLVLKFIKSESDVIAQELTEELMSRFNKWSDTKTVKNNEIDEIQEFDIRETEC